MGAMSFGQIEKLWTDNGGDPLQAPLFAAIALAESGGDPTEVNTDASTGDWSVGLWQVNYRGTGPGQYSTDPTQWPLYNSRVAAYGTPQALQGNANQQAKAAISISSNGKNVQPWQGDPVAAAVMQGKPIPSQYTDGQTVTPGNLSLSNYEALATSGQATNNCPDPTSTSFTFNRQGGCCSNVYLYNASPVHLINECQAQEIAGLALMIVGGFVAVLGVGVLVASAFGRTNPLTKMATQALGSRATTRTQRQRSQIRTQEAVTIAESRASARRSAREPRQPSQATINRWRSEGFESA